MVSIRRDGQEVAYGTGYPNGSGQSWVRVEYRLRSAEGRDGTFRGIRVNTPNWTVQDAGVQLASARGANPGPNSRGAM